MKQKLTTLFLLFAAAAAFFVSCDDDDSYAERRERERDQISSFLRTGVQIKQSEGDGYLLNVPGSIKVISEDQFYRNDSTTNVDENEYVLFSGSGVYMQIVRKGVGSKLEHGDGCNVICRYTEYNIASDTLQSTNNLLAYETMPDVMTVRNNYGVFSAAFVSGVMSSRYNSKSVPSGWLIPLTFINLGRQNSEDAEIAKVRLILPSTEGQSDALSNVYPCFYEITYERGR